MDAQVHVFRASLRDALKSAQRFDTGVFIPTMLVQWPERALKKIGPGHTVADAAIAYLTRYGLRSDRTKMNLYGYPGIFRSLGEPPPWVHLGMGDMNAGADRQLRPLYLRANEEPADQLMARMKVHLEEQEKASRWLDMDPFRPVVQEVQDFRLLRFQDDLRLARCLGIAHYESLYEAIFDFDEYTAAVGAPDLFVWDADEGIWFFAEVKGPGDHLRPTQAAWLHQNWDAISGRFIILVVSIS